MGGSGDAEYTPPKELTDFLAKGSPPVYIGFGSVVVDDPDALTKTIFEAVKQAGVRAIVSQVRIASSPYVPMCYRDGAVLVQTITYRKTFT